MDLPLSAMEPSFERHLRASNRSPRTVQTYLFAFRAFQGFLVASGGPTACRSVKRAHVESFVATRLTRVKPATVSVQFRALQQFFKWAVDEDEIRASPMARIRAPIVPEEFPAVLEMDEVRRLLRACSGQGFLARRTWRSFACSWIPECDGPK